MDKRHESDDPLAKMAFVIGLVLFLFGAIVPPMLFPDENPILVGFIGAPFILFGIIVLIISAFPTRRLQDRSPPDKKEEK